jgi:hypothetical protein
MQILIHSLALIPAQESLDIRGRALVAMVALANMGVAGLKVIIFIALQVQ